MADSATIRELLITREEAMTELLTEAEAAALLKIATKTLGNLRRRGEGPPCVRIARMVRYYPDALEEWARARTTPPSAICTPPPRTYVFSHPNQKGLGSSRFRGRYKPGERK